MALYVELKVWDGQFLKTVGNLEVLRDITDDPNSEVGNYTVERDACGKAIGRVKGFDRKRGAWALAQEALKLVKETS